MEDYSGYDWINVPKYKMDSSKTWEERYKDLEQHHIDETTFLIDEVRFLAARLRVRDMLYSINSGISIDVTPEIRTLAEKIVAHKDDPVDIDAWAERIAKDVADADD